MSHITKFVVYSACLENMFENLSTIIHSNEYYMNAKDLKKSFYFEDSMFVNIFTLQFYLHILYSKCIVPLLLQILLQTILQCHPTDLNNIFIQNRNSCHNLLSAFNSIFIASDV